MEMWAELRQQRILGHPGTGTRRKQLLPGVEGAGRWYWSPVRAGGRCWGAEVPEGAAEPKKRHGDRKQERST